MIMASEAIRMRSPDRRPRKCRSRNGAWIGEKRGTGGTPKPESFKRMLGSTFSSLSLEKLHLAFVFLGRGSSRECSEVAPLPGLRILVL